jgi:hypothetical protein
MLNIMNANRLGRAPLTVLAGCLALCTCGGNRYEVAYDFLMELSAATVSSPAPRDVRVHTVDIAGDARQAIQVPGKTELTYSVLVPQKARLEFGSAVAPHCWDKPGDGALFEIIVSTGSDRDVIVHSRYIDAKTNVEARRWFDERVTLTAFEGQRVMVRFAVKPGPADDSRFDASVWSHPRLFGLAR